MKSIQTKFIALMLGCVLLSSFIIGGAGVFNAQAVIDEDSSRIMNLACSEKAGQLDSVFSRIEQSVETLAVFTVNQLDSPDKLKLVPAYEAEYTKSLESVAINMAGKTEGVISVYIRYNPEFASPTAGLFWGRRDMESEFEPLATTNLSNYSSDDIEHVGWYYIPVKRGIATWMAPYTNQIIGKHVISYVIPIYKNNETIGIVGMDIDFQLITDIVSQMRIYDSGYAFLLDRDGTVMYHRELPSDVLLTDSDSSLIPVVSELEKESSFDSLFSYNWKGVKKKLAFRSLRNGMRLALTAPVSEIDASKNQLILQIFIAVFLISAVSVILAILLARRIVRPLRELNGAARKIADGDLSVSISCETDDEIGTLAKSLRQTVEHLRVRIDYINGLAYQDSMTGSRNKTAYQDVIRQLDHQIITGRPDFAILVLDINDLKYVNDHFGHAFGDQLILTSYHLIEKAFAGSNIYRIGGDEFVILLEQEALDRYEQSLTEFESDIAAHNQSAAKENRISIAYGFARFNPKTDLTFTMVFKRADRVMYQHKASAKKSRK